MSTNITGNIKDLSGGAVTSNTYLRFILRGLNGNIPRVNGTALVAQNPGFGLTGYWFDLVPNASGQISGTLYSTRDAAGTGNGEIEAGGSLTAVWYGMVLFTGGNPSAEIPVHAKNGVTLDISNVTPISTTPVSTAPTGDTTYARLDGGNMPFTGQVQLKDGTAASPGISFGSEPTTGFFKQAAAVIGGVISGTCRWLLNATGTLLGSGGGFGWSSNTDPSAASGDLFLSRAAAGVLQVGTALNNASGKLLLRNLENIRFADQFSGADIFAQAIAAATDIGASFGMVVIPPGNYGSITTTLTFVSGIVYVVKGCKFTYSGTGTAIKFANVQDSGLIGPCELIGPGTGGSTVGLQVGIGSSGTGVVTTYSYLEDIHIKTFATGFVGEGSSSNNGTFSNHLQAIIADGCNIGFKLIPTVANQFNANEFVNCVAISNVSDGWKIDGANGNSFPGSRAELNGGFGWNFAGTQQTTNNSIHHSWNEANTSGDFNSGSGTNVIRNAIIGGIALSSPVFAGTWGKGNIRWLPGSFNDVYADVNVTSTFTWDSTLGANFAFALVNKEGSPSFSNVLGLSRTGSGSGAGTGNLYAGSTEYPFSLRSTVPLYNNIATVGNGLSASYGQDDKTGQSASIGAVTLFTGTSSSGGHWEVNFSTGVTTSDASGATYTVSVSWTEDGTVRTFTSSSVAFSGGSTRSSVPMNPDNSTNITYSTTVTGAPTTGRYSVHVWAKKQ